MRGTTSFAFAALVVCTAAPASAIDIHGRFEFQDVYASEDSQSLSAALDLNHRNDAMGDVRLIWEPRWGAWNASLHYELSFDAGDAPALAARERALRIFPPAPPATWLNLTDTFIDQSHLTARHRLDRLSLGYTGSHLVIRAGRQALTWGAGLVFRPMDLFDPFSPDAIDTEYKPGTDMLYGQYLFDDGSDLQIVVVPRQARRGGGLTENASSFALHFHTTIGNLQTTWLLARDHGDTVAAIGVNGALGGATWTAEVVPTFVRGGGTFTSAILNISDAMTLWDRDITLFAEYYRNGFGLGARRYALTDLPAPLVDRLVRGQVFDTGRDYLTAGAMYQWTPLFHVDPTLIANLDDRSLYVITQATWSVEENLNLIAGAQFALGPSNSEFGGLALAGRTPPFFEQPVRFYVQIRRYF